MAENPLYNDYQGDGDDYDYYQGGDDLSDYQDGDDYDEYQGSGDDNEYLGNHDNNDHQGQDNRAGRHGDLDEDDDDQYHGVHGDRSERNDYCNWKKDGQRDNPDCPGVEPKYMWGPCSDTIPNTSPDRFFGSHGHGRSEPHQRRLIGGCGRSRGRGRGGLEPQDHPVRAQSTLQRRVGLGRPLAVCLGKSSTTCLGKSTKDIPRNV